MFDVACTSTVWFSELLCTGQQQHTNLLMLCWIEMGSVLHADDCSEAQGSERWSGKTHLEWDRAATSFWSHCFCPWSLVSISNCCQQQIYFLSTLPPILLPSGGKSLSYTNLLYRFQGVVWSTSKVTCVHAWNLLSFAEHLKWSLICSQPENPGPQLNLDLMAALLNLKSSATLNKQICHSEVIAARYRKPRVPRCQIVKGSTVEQRFMGH